MRLRYVKTYRSKRCLYSYYRRQGHEIRIDGDVGSPAWLKEYQRIHESFEQPGREQPGKGTLGALILEYKRSPEFLERASKTRKDYSRYLDMLVQRFGDLPVKTIPRAFVLGLRDEFQDKPRTANYVVQILRLLLSFAIDRGYRNDNPAARPRMLKTGEGHRPWTVEQIKRFMVAATPPMRLAVQLAVFTGQRQSDILKMTWSQYSDGIVEVVQEKTRTAVWIPAHRELRATLDNCVKTNLVILTTENGRPFKADHFRHMFRRQILRAGLDGLTFHGLRKTSTAMLAEAGCTDREIMAITGHRSHEMVSLYLHRAEQKNRATAAIRKLESKGS